MKLQTGTKAYIATGHLLVPCTVTAVRPSRPHERFQHHVTVRLDVDVEDHIRAGDTATSEAGRVFPCAALNEDGSVADFEFVCDQGEQQ